MSITTTLQRERPVARFTVPTVFETLRNERLEHARAALASDAVPMKDIAFRVGYNHVTNFINTFAIRYGAPPRQLARAQQAAEDDAG